MKVRKKPVVVDAFRLTDNWFDSDHPNPQHIVGFTTDPKTRTVVIPTLEGNHTARIGDWIIRGVKGEYYPCKPDIFEQTYEFVGEPDDENWVDRTYVERHCAYRDMYDDNGYCDTKIPKYGSFYWAGVADGNGEAMCSECMLATLLQQLRTTGTIPEYKDSWRAEFNQITGRSN